MGITTLESHAFEDG